MVYSTYRFALLTFNLLCSIEAMKESFVGGDSVVDAYGAEDKGQKLQVSLGEHDTGHGETEDEANGEDVAFVEVTASGALTTIARPRNSSLVEAVQADEAESAGEAEEDEDAEESDEVDGATLTGEAEKTKEAENDQPHPLAAEADRVRAATAAKYCFECISKDFVFCKDSGVNKCFVSDSVADNNNCMVQVKKAGQSAEVTAKTAPITMDIAPEVFSSKNKFSQSKPVPPATSFADCGVFVGKASKKKLVDCAKASDNCQKDKCDKFCRDIGQDTCVETSDRAAGSAQTVTGWVCSGKCHKDRKAAAKGKCTNIVTAAAMETEKSKQFKAYPDCQKGQTSECRACIDQNRVFCKDT